MPHNEIAGPFTATTRTMSAKDVAAIVPRLQHVSAVFAAVLREFRASLPANERNRGLPPISAKPHRPADRWRPILDTFPPVQPVAIFLVHREEALTPASKALVECVTDTLGETGYLL